MGKTRVGVLLRESVGGNKSTNKSSDLEKLRSNYEQFCKQIRSAVGALSNHHANMQKLEQSRQDVANTFAKLAKDTPLYDSVGLMPSADRPAHTVCSYSSVHDELAAKAKSYVDKYQQFVLDYILEYEKVFRTRIDAGIKKSDELRIELDHYQKKVESLRLTVNQSMAKGKPVSSATQEKLTRNEEKLLHSKQNYNKLTTDLCILIEEVTERNWRDLHPLLVKCSQFDMTMASDEAKVLANLNNVLSSLKQVANDNGISPQPRLKDLAGLKPELLSTRPGGVAGLAIEAGYANLSPTTAFAPGMVGAQGMGGFPVQISPSSNQNPHPLGRSTSFTSTQSAPHSTLNMLTIHNSAAPAPTLDDVYNSMPNSTRSAPSSGNLPPLPPSTMTPQNWSVRSSSFNDADSAYSDYSNFSAPVGAPPRPPSLPPPPPPGSYGSSPYGGAPTSYGGAPAPTSYGGAPAPTSYGGAPAPALSMYGQHQPASSGYNPFG